MSKNWIPEIMYEETEDGISSHIPFVMVPPGENMPLLLYVFESRETGEYEPNLEGNPVPIISVTDLPGNLKDGPRSPCKSPDI